MGIQPTPPQPIAGKGKHIGLVVVPTVEPYLFLDKRSEIWINTTSNQVSTPAVGVFVLSYVVGALNIGRNGRINVTLNVGRAWQPQSR
jgi:hypothetical protein